MSAPPATGASSGAPRGGPLARFAALTPTGQARVPAAWSLYDFANTIFSFAIVSGAIGLWLTSDSQFGERDGNVLLSVAVIVSVGINALVSPPLGALSDRGGRRLPFLFFFTALCVVPTAFIGLSPAFLGLVLFIVANFSYQAALIYYDATLKTVSKPETRGRLSGIGTAIGYCGTVFVGLLIFFLEIPVEDRFFLAALLYALFSIPIFLVVREPRREGPAVTGRDIVESFGQVRRTVRHAREVPGLLRFLVGRFFYSDAVNTVIVVMSVVTVEAMELSAQTANLVLLSLTLVAIAASFGWGWLTDRLGPKRTLVIVLLSWAVGLVLGAVSIGLDAGIGLPLFLLAGAILGSGLGGVSVSDRVLLVRLSPPDHLGEFFGLYGLVGKGSQVIGQLLYALVIYLFIDQLGDGAYQLAVLSLLVTMIIGLWIIRPVSDVWAGSGELVAGVVAEPPPERLSPDRSPIEPRDR